MNTITDPRRHNPRSTQPIDAARGASAERPRTLDDLRHDPRRAICEEFIVCLICGRLLRQLTNTHLRAEGTTASEYKSRFGYNRRRPLMALSLRRQYASRAVATGLADRIRRRPILLEPELRRRGGARTIALEEYLTRRDARLRSRAAPSSPGAAPPSRLGRRAAS